MRHALAALLAMSICTITLAKPLYAQTASDPLLSLKRLSIGAGVDRQVLNESAIPEERWLGVLSLAYNVLSPTPAYSGPRVSLIARFDQPFSAEARPYGVIGFRVTLWNGAR